MSKKSLILSAFILLKFILQFLLLSPDYELHRDEFLHLDQAKHLAWGYFSVPPITSWISLIILFLGNSIFWIKFFPALFGALTILVVWKTIEELKGTLFALILGSTCILISVLLRLNTLYQPNSLDVLCWTAFYYFVIKYLNSANSKWLLYGALVIAIGFLNKYNVVFLLAGLFPAILLSPERKVFSNPKFYMSLGLALLLILPNLIWQYQNNFPVIAHMKELSATQLVNVNRGDFLKTQLLFYISGVYLIILSLIAFWKYSPFQKYRSFFWAFFFTLIIFTYLRAKDYYAIGLYPIYIAFGSIYFDRIVDKGRWKYLRIAALLLPLFFFTRMNEVAFPNKSPQYILQNQEQYRSKGMLRWEDGKEHPLPQDFADMLGWKELAAKVDSAYLSLPSKEHTIVLCDNYGQAGAINYYTKRNIKAVSFNADYLNWIDLSKPFKHLIRIKEAKDQEYEIAETSPYFVKSQRFAAVENKNAREFGTTVFIFSGSKIDINERLKREIEEKKF